MTGKSRPPLIAITGPDGAGKSSVVKELQARFGADSVKLIDRWDVLSRDMHPQCGFIGASRDELRACMTEMPGPARVLFLFWTFAMMLDGQLASDSSRLIVLDSYWMKHAAAEIVYGADREWIEAMARCLPKPDVTIVLDLEPGVAAQRKSKLIPYECGMDPEARVESFVRHQRALRAILLEWTTREHWVRIEASAPLPSVVDGILERVPRRAGQSAFVERRAVEDDKC